MRILHLLFIAIITFACGANNTKNELNNTKEFVKTTADSSIKNSLKKLNFETYKVNHTWGYKIYQDSNMMINQPHIPSIQGNKGFSSQFKAAVAAQFIMEKLNNNIFPPSFSLNELDSLGLLD